MISLWLGVMVASYLAGAGGALLLRRLPSLMLGVAHGATAVGAISGLLLAATGWASGGGQYSVGALTPFAQLALRLDPLACFFLGLIALLTLAAAIYAVGYVRPSATQSPLVLGGGLPLFALMMSLVVLADDAFAFLICWETMSLVSYFLVVVDHTSERVRRAGFIYLVMTHVGTALILIAFLVLAGPTGAFGFDGLRVAALSLPGPLRDLVFVLTLIGFGTKAGLAPVHVWLPRAHPVAPSHISALMSGVMIKTGIYGLLRVGWDLLGPGPAWWGLLVLVVGVGSALLGVLYAYTESDLKRLLAFSTVENAGLIALGLGVALIARGLDLAELAALGILAALLHCLNHGLFKGLLFLAAGAILHTTGTRNLERLGGLLRRMPVTGLLMMVGMLALAALPPLNGFASEWLLLQSLLGLGRGAPGWYAVLAGLAAAGLALTGALALATGVKAIGIGLLGMPRSHDVDHAHEAPLPMLLPMIGLAGLCLAGGLVPGLLLPPLADVTRGLGLATPPPASSLVILASPLTATSQLSPLLLAVGLSVLAPLPWLLLRLLAGPVPRRIGPTWVCGEPLSPRMQYTGASFSKPIRLIFRAIIQPVRTLAVTYQGTGRYFLATMAYHGETRPLAERYLYTTVQHAVLTIARVTRVVQNGNTRLYLTYVFVTLVVLLIVAR